ncbi:MAG: R3H domain-containing nucleic acid-binding protein [Fimbriimonadales bacterium]
MENGFAQELELLLATLPPQIRSRIESAEDKDRLIEVVLDYGRPSELRFMDRFERYEDHVVSEEDLRYVSDRVSEFGGDNRAGIERTLHRISAIRNRQGKIIGLTCRVGRAIHGTIDVIEDLVASNKSILLLGKPGVGKTTKLREMARTLADDLQKRVVIVDTSNEIAGDGDIPHSSIGSARRMPVSDPARQHQVMIEAVENHMPEVIVIDEIGTEAEAYAARTIGERGVQLVGTAHGRTLENLMMNPTLCDLVGGIQAVTLSDEEAKRRGTQKTVLERKAPPTFDVLIELIDYERVAIHHDVQKTVDTILRGMVPQPEIRVRTAKGDYQVLAQPRLPEQEIEHETDSTNGIFEEETKAKSAHRVMRIFPYGIARTRLERAIREKRMHAVISSEISDADAVIAMRSSLQQRPNKLRERAGRNIPTFVVKSNTLSQILATLDDIIRGKVERSPDEEEEAKAEALEAVEIVKAQGKAFDLSPRPHSIRRIQHDIVESFRLRSEAVGQDPDRRVRILPIAS